MATIKELERKGDINRLIVALAHPDEQMRAGVVMALGRLGDHQAFEPLINTLGNDVPTVRLYALVALEKIGDRRALPEMVRSLDDKDDKVKVQAAMVLGNMGDARSVPALIKSLSSDVWNLKVAASEALVEIGNPAIPEMTRAVKDGHDDVQLHIVKALGRIASKETVPALIHALNTTEENVRVQASDALVNVGKPAVPTLIEVLSYDNRDFRFRVVEILGRIGDEKAIEHLETLLKTEKKHRGKKKIKTAIREIRKGKT